MELQYLNNPRKIDTRLDHFNYKFNNCNNNQPSSGIATMNNKYLTLDPSIIAASRQR